MALTILIRRLTAQALMVVVGLTIATHPAVAQTGDNVLVVINAASKDSVQIGARYASVRKIPAENVLGIRTETGDELDRGRFDNEIERPVAEWLTRHRAYDRILYIVLTKGIPLRIRGTTGLHGTVSSVDSELALIYRKLLGGGVPPTGRIRNPYFEGETPTAPAVQFSHRDHDIYLVTRLDAFTVDDVMGLIDRGSRPASRGSVVLDQRNPLGDKSGDVWLSAAARRLSASAVLDRVVLDTSLPAVTGITQVLGYYSWGSNDPSITQRRPDVSFAPGALAAMFVSTDARTFSEPPAEWTLGKWQEPQSYFAGTPQSLAGDLIRQGVTGVAGHVAEPFLDGSIRPQILFPAYLAGLNLAEAYYRAMPFLSWQTVVVGDPLCAPFRSRHLDARDAAPGLDPETELPAFFSVRRLDTLLGFGVASPVAKLLLKANARLIAGNRPGAQEALEAVTVMEPRLNAAHFILAGLYEQTNQFDKAAARYRTILTTRSDDVRALNNLAYIIAVREKAPQEALPLAERAYSLAPDREMSTDLGYALVARRGTPLNSLPFSEQAFDVGSTHAQIADTLGWTHFLLGQLEQAEKYLSEAVLGAPANAEIQLHIAELEAARGRREQALAALKLASELDPNIEERGEVRQLRARLTQ